MHLLFYYYLACSVTLWVKYPHVGIVSGIGFLYYWQDHILCLWGSIAGTICGFAAIKATNKVTDWKIALSHAIIAFIAFHGLYIVDVPLMWKLPLVVFFDIILLERSMILTKTVWSSMVAFLCLAIFPDNFKSQLNVLAAASLFLTVMTSFKF